MKIKLIKFKRVKSTNDIAIKLIKSNKIQPTLIFSEKQTKRRGTRGKKWISRKGNLFVTVFFKFDPKKIKFQEYAILNAYIIRKIISKFISKKINIKWPNDIIIEKKKVCGILQEIVSYKEEQFLLVGMGLNIQSSPTLYNLKTTFLKKYTKKKLDKNKILKDIKAIYEKLFKDSKKYQFLHLKKKIK